MLQKLQTYREWDIEGVRTESHKTKQMITSVISSMPKLKAITSVGASWQIGEVLLLQIWLRHAKRCFERSYEAVG